MINANRNIKWVEVEIDPPEPYEFGRFDYAYGTKPITGRTNPRPLSDDLDYDVEQERIQEENDNQVFGAVNE